METEIYVEIFLSLLTFYSRQRRNPNSKATPTLNLTMNQALKGGKMPSILEKPCEDNSFLDKGGPGNTAKTDRISSYLPHEHWYCKLSCPISFFFNLLAYPKIFIYLKMHVIWKKKKKREQIFRNKWT